MKIRMPKKLFDKWIKALESGEYKQAKGVVYNPNTAGFCCLGVLQHVQSGGSCELAENEEFRTHFGPYRTKPSDEWYYEVGVIMPPNLESELMERNDGVFAKQHSFKRIAAFIKRSTETY